MENVEVMDMEGGGVQHKGVVVGYTSEAGVVSAIVKCDDGSFVSATLDRVRAAKATSKKS